MRPIITKRRAVRVDARNLCIMMSSRWDACNATASSENQISGKNQNFPQSLAGRQLGFTNRAERSRSDVTRLDREIAQRDTGGRFGKHFGQCRRSKGLFDLSQCLIDPKVERTQIHSM